METDYLIIGQGIAGSAFAFQCLRYNRDVVVVDREEPDASSMVAGGLFNPVTGKRKVKTWLAEELFSCLHSFYPEMEKWLNTRFFYPMPIFRPFGSEDDRTQWLKKKDLDDYRAFLSAPLTEPHSEKYVKDPHGGFEITQSGFLDVRVMLKAFRNYLEARNKYINDDFKPEDIHFMDDSVEWKGIKARKVILCQGNSGVNNPWFNYLPFNPVKGELMDVRIPGMSGDKIIQKRVYILPYEGDLFKVGATYRWNRSDTDLTGDSKEELINQLEKILELKDYKVENQYAGIRPAVTDRRPLVGLHYKHTCLGIFNGLGTKGVSLAPYFAGQFFDFLENKGELDQEVDIARFNPA